MPIWQGDSVLLDTVEVDPPVGLPLIRQSSPINTEIRSEAAQGDIYPRFLSAFSQKPAPTFTTRAAAKALATIGVLGLPVTAGPGPPVSPGIVFTQQQLEENTGRPASGAVHKTFTHKAGLLLIRRMSCDHQGELEVETELITRWDGTNAPIIEQENAALPTGVVDDERFSINGAKIGTFTVPNNINIEVDFGITADSAGIQSDHWDRFVKWDQMVPTIRLRGIDPDVLKAAGIPLQGRVAAHTDSLIEFRKRNNDTLEYVAGATAEHISVTIAGAAFVETAFDSSDRSPTESEILITGRFDGTNAPIVLKTDAQLSIT